MEKNKNSIKIKKTSAFLVLYLCIIFLVLLNATKGFSYDYQYYLSYIKEIKERDLDDLISSLRGVYVPLKLSTGGVEVGFVVFVKLFTYISSNVTVTYALMAIFSLHIKSKVLMFFKVKWYWIYLILTYSCVLLEANAIRSGVSLSVFMLSIQCYFKKKYSLMLVLWALAASLHLQALFFIFCFTCILLLNVTNFTSKRWSMSLVTLAALFSGVLLSKTFQVFTSEKLEVYALNESVSGGVNLVTILSLALMGIVFILIINRVNKEQPTSNSQKSFIGLMLISLSTLSIYTFFTSVDVVGDRLWQWGFILFCMSYFGIYRRKSFTMSKALLMSCLIINLLNVAFRYPLTNLFYPLIPYTDFSNISL